MTQFSYVKWLIDISDWESGSIFCLLEVNSDWALPMVGVGYFSNLACDWLNIAWAFSEQETENGPRLVTRVYSTK